MVSQSTLRRGIVAAVSFAILSKSLSGNLTSSSAINSASIGGLRQYGEISVANREYHD